MIWSINLNIKREEIHRIKDRDIYWLEIKIEIIENIEVADNFTEAEKYIKKMVVLKLMSGIGIMEINLFNFNIIRDNGDKLI